MLKKITVSALFAITLALGMGVANAKTIEVRKSVQPVPHGFCPMACPLC